MPYDLRTICLTTVYENAFMFFFFNLGYGFAPLLISRTTKFMNKTNMMKMTNHVMKLCRLDYAACTSV